MFLFKISVILQRLFSAACLMLPVLTSELGSGFGTETLKTVKCGTEDWAGSVSTWEDISVAL